MRRARRRWSVARRSPIPRPCANSIAADLDSPASCCRRDRATRRSPASELFALPSMAPVRKALDAEFDRYIARHKADLPNETIGVGTAFDFQLFDRALLYSDHDALRAGGHRQPDGPRLCLAEANCGEIRLIYRLTRTDDTRRAGEGRRDLAAPADDAQRRAEGQRRYRRSGRRRSPITCAEIARRWLAAGDWPLTGAELAGKLTVRGWSAGFDRGPKTSTASRPIFRSRMRRNRRCAISAPTISSRCFDYNAPSRDLRGSAAGKPDRSRADSGG